MEDFKFLIVTVVSLSLGLCIGALIFDNKPTTINEAPIINNAEKVEIIDTKQGLLKKLLGLSEKEVEELSDMLSDDKNLNNERKSSK